MYYTVEDRVCIDWTHRGAYMEERHGVTPAEANEALADPFRVVLNPDPSSQSGKSIRVIGHAPSSRRLLTVVLLEDAGVRYGVNGWEASATDVKRYVTGGVGS